MVIAISCGEPAGIGPEVAAKAWAALQGELDMLWIGDPRHLPPGTRWVAVPAPLATGAGGTNAATTMAAGSGTAATGAAGSTAALPSAGLLADAEPGVAEFAGAATGAARFGAAAPGAAGFGIAATGAAGFGAAAPGAVQFGAAATGAARFGTAAPGAAAGRPLPVLVQDFGPPPIPGRPQPALAAGVIAAIATAVRLAQAGLVRGICTAPIAKAALASGAGFAYPGHTEFLAALAGVPRAVMMLACDSLRVVPVTIHIPLAQVAAHLTPALLDQTIRITAAGLIRDCGIARPRIAVAGLNPHAGEDGRMGDEERSLIAPVLQALRQDGLDIAGPLPADTMFHPAARARYDVAICMYHDQALIPIKTLDFAGGVNVTLGLPFIRTSPDHGTAFDIAGLGQADPTSMIAAVRMAARMARAREA